MTFALMLAFFRDDMGFGGNTGLNDFRAIAGRPIDADGTRAALFALTALVLAAVLVATEAMVRSKFGKVLIAIRDAPSRARFVGYRIDRYQVAVFTASAMLAGLAGALYVPQLGIINPSEFAPQNSIEAVIWVAVGGRGTLVGAALGAVLINLGKTWLTDVLPDAWLFALGLLFILVTILMPRGILSLFDGLRRARRAPLDEPGRARHRCRPAGQTAGRVEAMEGAVLTRSLLYLDDVRVSFDGYKALRGLSLVLAPGEMRAIIRAERCRQDHHDGCHNRQDAPRRRRRVLRRDDRPHPPRRAVHRRTRHRPQVPEADRLREPHGGGQHPPVPQGQARAVRHPVRPRAGRPGPTHRPHPRHDPPLAPPRAPRRRPQPRAEAVAGDRDVAGAGPEAPPRGRTPSPA